MKNHFSVLSGDLFHIGSINTILKNLAIKMISIRFTILDSIRLKCDCIGGVAVNGLKQSILLNSLLDKIAGPKLLCEPEKLHYIWKKFKSVLITITFYSEDDNHKGVVFKGRTKTFFYK